MPVAEDSPGRALSILHGTAAVGYGSRTAVINDVSAAEFDRIVNPAAMVGR